MHSEKADCSCHFESPCTQWIIHFSSPVDHNAILVDLVLEVNDVIWCDVIIQNITHMHIIFIISCYMHVHGTVCCILADQMSWNVSVKLQADSGCKHFQNALYSMMFAGRTHTHRQKKAVDTDPNLGLDPLAATGSMPAVYRNSGNAKLDSNGTPNGYEANKRDLLTNFRLGANMMMGYCISKVKSININLLSCWEIKATNWNSMLVSKILGLSHWMPVLCLKISPRLRYWSSSTPKHTP